MTTGAPDYLRPYRSANRPYPVLETSVSGSSGVVAANASDFAINQVLSSTMPVVLTRAVFEVADASDFMAKHSDGFVFGVRHSLGGTTVTVFRRSYSAPSDAPVEYSPITTYYYWFRTVDFSDALVPAGATVQVPFWNGTAVSIDLAYAELFYYITT